MKEKGNFAMNHWNLTGGKAIYENVNKAVYSAWSAEYGSVILKINQDTLQLNEEYEMLKALNGNGCCKVFAYDAERGILLEERLLPGTVLREEGKLGKRIQAFKSVFDKIHIEASRFEAGKATKVQSYLDWLESACHFCRNNRIDKNLNEKVKHAKDICVEMFEKYLDRVLLHGDLHHDNILLREDGTYAMIDPKGVIGPKLLDVPRFVMNEIGTKHILSDEEHMLEVIRMVSESLGFSREDVAKIYFMEVILGNIWCVEDGEDINAEEIELATKLGCLYPI